MGSLFVAAANLVVLVHSLHYFFEWLPLVTSRSGSVLLQHVEVELEAEELHPFAALS